MISSQNVPEQEVFQGVSNPSASKHALRCALAAEALRVSGTLSLPVFGCSMLPSLWPGDILLVGRVRSCQIGPGMLVIYARGESFIVHRVISCNRNVLITRGDALNRNDAPVRPSQVLGEVVAIQRGRAQLVPKRRLTSAQKLLCFFFHRSERFRSLALRLYSLRRAIGPSQPISEWSS